MYSLYDKISIRCDRRSIVKAIISSSVNVIAAFLSWDIRVELELVSTQELPLLLTEKS